jgi:hypothetical protein
MKNDDKGNIEGKSADKISRALKTVNSAVDGSIKIPDGFGDGIWKAIGASKHPLTEVIRNYIFSKRAVYAAAFFTLLFTAGGITIFMSHRDAEKLKIASNAPSIPGRAAHLDAVAAKKISADKKPEKAHPGATGAVENTVYASNAGNNIETASVAASAPAINSHSGTGGSPGGAQNGGTAALAGASFKPADAVQAGAVNKSGGMSIASVGGETAGLKVTQAAAVADISKEKEFDIRNTLINPLKGESVAIRYYVAQETGVAIRVYDRKGRLIKNIFNGDKTAGNYTEIWDGKDDNGAAVNSGIYIIYFRDSNTEKKTAVGVVK